MYMQVYVVHVLKPPLPPSLPLSSIPPSQQKARRDRERREERRRGGMQQEAKGGRPKNLRPPYVVGVS